MGGGGEGTEQKCVVLLLVQMIYVPGDEKNHEFRMSRNEAPSSAKKLQHCVSLSLYEFQDIMQTVLGVLK